MSIKAISDKPTWEIDSGKTANTQTNSTFENSVDSSAKYGGEALKVGVNAVIARFFGMGNSQRVDDAVDSSVSATSTAAKDWCIIS